ncbi:DNA-deoxyinosine glycosylase [Clostridium sp. MCC353]|uniref:DNA-deoxyinosine glycosylase n=1 Tax=Clostridium sp. MCC353 TaxID=2592646 RepID=UPI001C028A0C|nr:DNA-deoxyinosine glycosylase [Clostridium sp. MCC353]MBT9777384.1 DNA-deoxyinosine glycosylase [Clostridium sp. MCC353]
MSEIVHHQFSPIYDTESKILILGTIPSPKSREQGFYYGHPRNRFWKVLSDILNEQMPQTIEEKIILVKKHHIALWDVLASCEIRGADDASIKNPVPNDMNIILKQASIEKIYTTGSKATALYKKYCYPKTGIPSVMLPSTSPANCRMPYEQLKQEYGCIII